MEESEDNMSAEELKFDDGPVKNKPKKRSLVERELETSLTARVTSPLTNGDRTNTSRYGRARRLKSDTEFNPDKNPAKTHKSPKLDQSPSKVTSPAYKMHASNSPIRIETPKRDTSLESQIENIYSENVSLSRFSSEEKANRSATKKLPKVYIRKDLIQSKDKEDDTVVLIKNIFSPPKSTKKSNTHLENYLERSSEKYNLKKPLNGYLNTSSVVKTLDFDVKRKKKDEKKVALSKNELFELEAQCEYQVGDLAWARMGTFPFWPCIITRDPLSGTFIKKKLYGRFERDVLHVTFFGDNGRRGWIVGTMLRKFLGQLEFEVARNNFTPEAKKKDPRLYAAFFISEKKMPQWQISVDEAEMLLREPKRLRIDILCDMLNKGREIKSTPKPEKSKKIVRTNSDVSLSESLLDTLFSEDDCKGRDVERSRSKSGKKSLDVSDVVTACLDNMAAKSGNIKIQRQSHMDRWLQKAKSKTPEKSHLQSQLCLKIDRDDKVSNTTVLKKNLPKKPYNIRKKCNESQYKTENRLLSHQNEHDYSLKHCERNGPVILDEIEIEYENAEMFTSDVIEPGSGLGIISKVETLCDSDQANYESEEIDCSDKLMLSDVNDVGNTIIENQVNVQSRQGDLLDLKNELLVDSEIEFPLSKNESEIMGMNNEVKANMEDDENSLSILCNDDTVRKSNFMTINNQISKLSSPNSLEKENKQETLTESETATQVKESVMEQDNCVNNLDTDGTSSSLDLQSPVKETIMKENLSYNEELQPNSTATKTKEDIVMDTETVKKVEESIIEQDYCISNCDKPSNVNYDSIGPNGTLSSYNEHLLHQPSPGKESIVTVNSLHNEKLQPENSIENKTKEDILIVTETVTQVEESVMEQDSCFSRHDKSSKESNDSIPLDGTINTLDRHSLHQTSLAKESIAKENFSENEDLVPKNSIENKTNKDLIDTQILTQGDDSIMEQDHCFSSCDKSSKNDRLTPDYTKSNFELHHTTLAKDSILKENTSENKELESTDSIENKEDNFFSSHDKSSEESNEYIPPDGTINILDRHSLHQTSLAKESIAKQNFSENEDLEPKNSIENKTNKDSLIDTQILTQGDDSIMEQDHCFSSCDKSSKNDRLTPDDTISNFELHHTTLAKDSILKENISENKELESTDSIENKEDNLIGPESATQHEESVMEQDNCVSNCDETSKESSYNLSVDETSNSSDRDLLDQTIPIKDNLSENIEMKLNDGIETQDTALMEPDPSIQKEDSRDPLDNGSNDYDMPSKESYDRLNSDSSASTFDGLVNEGTKVTCIDKKNSCENKESHTVIDNKVSLDANDYDGIKNFHESSTILEKTTLEKATDELKSKEIELDNDTDNSATIPQSLKMPVVKEHIDDQIEIISEISKNNGDKTISGHDNIKKSCVSKKSTFENVMTNLGTKSLRESNHANSKEYKDNGIDDSPDECTTVGDSKDTMATISQSRININQQIKTKERHNDLKEFEIQLYNIFGLSNKKSPKSKLNLSINKHGKSTNFTDKMKTKVDNFKINSNDASKHVDDIIHRHRNGHVNLDNINTKSLISATEVSFVEAKIFAQKDHLETNNTNVCVGNMKELPQLKCDAETNFTGFNEKSSFKFHDIKPMNNISDTEKKITGDKVSKTLINDDSSDRIKSGAVSSRDKKALPQEKKVASDHKLSYDIRKALENLDFLKYLEINQDLVIEEQPDLAEEEVIEYLYKTWFYEENLKTDTKKNDEIQNAKLVNGMVKSPIKIKLSLDKSSKTNKKSYMVEITNDNEKCLNTSVSKFDEKKSDIDKINLNADNDIDQTKCTLKRSKRIKRHSRHGTYFEKDNSSNVEKDGACSEDRKVTPENKATVTSRLGNEIITNEKDETGKDFEPFSTKPSVLNGIKTDQTEMQLHSYDKTNCLEKLSPKVNGGHKAKLRSKRTTLVDCNIDSNTVSDDEKPLLTRQLRLTFSKNQSAYVADGEINTKDDTKDHKIKAEKDDTDTSIQSTDGENSFNNKNEHTEELFLDTKEALNNPDFLKYLEIKKDGLIDEHPELTEEELTNYLHKTWLYEERKKSDIKKADDVETVTNLVKGLNEDPTPPTVKRVRKKKVEKDDQVQFNVNSEVTIRKEKSKRKTIKQYFYKEHFSDIEDDIEFFEIGKPASNTPTLIKEIGEGGEFTDIDAQVEYEVDEATKVEEYFRQLIAPKPNLFKGLLREKLCEICEKVDNLLKCKGCHCMFHVDCVKKKFEVTEVATTVKGRKKKKRRGKKAKDQKDSDCQSDEKSQDPNGSYEMLNTSIENEIENFVVNADDFEAQLSAKMKEILGNQIENEYYSSAEELDWNDTNCGECKIVDVLPRKKDRGEIDYSNFKCHNCQKYDNPVCFVCQSAVSPKEKSEHRQRCQVAHCQKYYHLECLNHWPQTQFNAGQLSRQNNSKQLVEALTCPRHVCHTCVCDDPRGCKTRFSGDKLARCVRCPATYHTFTKCLPAGTQILTASHIICPRHYEHRPGTQPRHVNTGWCFICALGGTLICCEYCPTSFHAECLNIDPPEGGYMCEDCETGRLPLYGEMVWVKLGHYRWWPGIILHPCEIPRNILAVKHSQGEFVVRFFGQYDYYWVNRGRVFPFQEGDSGRISSQKSKIDAAFTMAMEHAQRACEVLKTASPNVEESMDIASSLLPPHYVKLKVNKPFGSLCGKKIDIEESSLTQCECDPNEIDPCGPYTQCLNRMLLTECGPTCRAGDRCNNRAFEKRLYPKMTPYRTPHRGWGLKTLEDVKAGQFVIEYVGELIDEQEFRRRMRRKQEVRDENFYYLTLDKERMIDAGPKGNLARFMNHSCEPNCETQKWTVLGDVRVGLFALYDIPANSELTFNYNLESTGIEKKQCMCGAKRCSGYIGEKPKQDDQPKKSKQTGIPTKRTNKKRKNVELSPSKPKQRVPRTYKPRELTEIEKDLLIIKNATNGMSSDSESSRLSIDSKESKTLKRRRIEDAFSPSAKKYKTDRVDSILES